MKTLSLLSRLVVNVMAGFGALLERCCRVFWTFGAGLWRRITGLYSAVVGYMAAIDWRKDAERKSSQDFDINDDEHTHPGARYPEEARTTPQDDCEAAWSEDTRRPEEEEEEEEEDDEDSYRADPTDDFYCEYDSTWETDNADQQDHSRSGWRPSGSRSQYKFRRFENAARDMQNYRHDYPCRSTEPWRQPRSVAMPNLNFYLGSLPSKPDEIYISTFHAEWFGDYDALEHVHTYIQWLFPLQEPGVNFEATPLTKDEIMMFLENATARKNLLKSYELMLDFYGIELCDKRTGKVKKAPKWEERFDNLNTHTHNNLRITRILKCLGTLGYAHYQAPLVHFFLEETLVHGQLPNVRDSVLNYFVFAVLDKKQRRKLIKFARKNSDCPESEFVWCPKNIQRKWAMSDYV